MGIIACYIADIARTGDQLDLVASSGDQIYLVSVATEDTQTVQTSWKIILYIKRLLIIKTPK